MKPDAKIKNFTPLLDTIVQEYGLITAAIYGRVWRYAQQENHVCQAAQDKIADELSLSRQTVMRHLKLLSENGYIKDHSPGLRHVPHTYTVTNKAHISIVVEAIIDTIGVPESNIEEAEVYQRVTPGVPESNLLCTTESLKETKETIKDTFIINDNKQLAKDKYFNAFHRKRWANNIQEDKFNSLLFEYGEPELIRAIEWAALKGFSDLTRIEAALKTMRKNGKMKPKESSPSDDGSLYV